MKKQNGDCNAGAPAIGKTYKSETSFARSGKGDLSVNEPSPATMGKQGKISNPVKGSYKEPNGG